jgi:hypothetical protein
MDGAPPLTCATVKELSRSPAEIEVETRAQNGLEGAGASGGGGDMPDFLRFLLSHLQSQAGGTEEGSGVAGTGVSRHEFLEILRSLHQHGDGEEDNDDDDENNESNEDLDEGMDEDSGEEQRGQDDPDQDQEMRIAEEDAQGFIGPRPASN